MQDHTGSESIGSGADITGENIIIETEPAGMPNGFELSNNPSPRFSQRQLSREMQMDYLESHFREGRGKIETGNALKGSDELIDLYTQTLRNESN